VIVALPTNCADQSLDRPILAAVGLANKNARVLGTTEQRTELVCAACVLSWLACRIRSRAELELELGNPCSRTAYALGRTLGLLWNTFVGSYLDFRSGKRR